MTIENKVDVTDPEGEKKKALEAGKSAIILHGQGFQVKSSTGSDVVVIRTQD